MTYLEAAITRGMVQAGSILVWAGLSFGSNVYALEIIAHRGASHEAPENTLPAVKLAWEKNADAVEIDVYLTRDGKIAVIHDRTTKRTGGKDKKVSEQTLAELKTLDVGKWKGKKGAKIVVPTLGEVLATVPRGKRLFIEIKCGAEILPELSRVIKKSKKKPEQIVLIGFSFELMKAVKQKFPRHRISWLCSFQKNKQTGVWSPTADKLIKKAKSANLDGLGLSRGGPLDSKFVAEIKAARLELYVWTVNQGSLARQLKGMGVDGIITDRPEFLRKELAAKAAPPGG